MVFTKIRAYEAMASLLLLDEKICFIRLPPDTLQNFWQVISLRISFEPKGSPNTRSP
jgi:hypothetical protein